MTGVVVLAHQRLIPAQKAAPITSQIKPQLRAGCDNLDELKRSDSA